MSGHSTKREVVRSLFFRIGGMGSGFASNYLLLRGLGASNYGTWAALTSLLVWIQLSDFGIGYALKNRIASSSQSKNLFPMIGGVFQFYTALSIIVSLVFFLASDGLAIVRQYQVESLLLYLGAILFFPLTIGSAILQGARKNSVVSFMGLAQGGAWLMIVAMLTMDTPSLKFLSLMYVALLFVIGLTQCALGIVQLNISFAAAFGEVLNLKNIYLALPLCSVGLRFILLQLSSLALFSLGTYLTYNYLSPKDAAKFDVLFKFFQLPVTLFSMVVSVYWTEISRSFSKHENLVLKKKFSQLHAMAFFSSLLTLAFSLYVAVPLIKIYSGNKIDVQVSDTLVFWMLTTLQMIAYSGAVFLNAAEKLYGQIIIALSAAVLLIPLVSALNENGFGFLSAPLATVVLIIPSMIYCNWAAYYRVIKKIS